VHVNCVRSWKNKDPAVWRDFFIELLPIGWKYFFAHNKGMKKLIFAFGVLSITGCATIIDGGPDAINIATSDGSRVIAEVNTKAGIQTVVLPGLIVVPKSCNGVTIQILADDKVQQSHAVIHSGVNPWIFGSIVFGGVVGVGIDAISGTICRYDRTDVVQIVRK